jgi:hypothetical protein
MKMNMQNNDQKIEKKFQEIESAISPERTPISFEALEQTINKWLLIQDKGIIKVLAATVIANKLTADPVWLFIVAASGGAKTELIRGLNTIEGIYPISDLTPQTFLSGLKDTKKASLLLRLPPYGTILTYKDFTTVLTMHRDKRHEILSQLREIYDGYYRKEFGTGETKAWEGKMGFIAGVTSVIDNHQSIFQVLGERFIQYRPEQPDARAAAKKAMANSGKEKEMRTEIQNAFADFISGVDIDQTSAEIPEDIKERITYLATFCVRARSGIIRDGYSNREIELIPDIELPTRLAKQLATLAVALSLIDNTAPEENYELIHKIGLDILPMKRRMIIATLIRATTALETADIAVKIGYPTNTTRRILEDLFGLMLIERIHGGRADTWKITDYTRGILEKAKPASMTSENQTTATEEITLPEKSDEAIVKTTSLFGKTNNSTLPDLSNE